MTDQRRPRRGAPAKEPSAVVRRPRSDRKRLEPEFEALAAGEVDRLGGPAPRPRLADPRPQFLVPGVANRDARAVFEARVQRLSELADVHREQPDEDVRHALGEALAEAAALGLWRGRSLTGFDALAEEVLEIPAADARTMAAAAGAPGDDLRPLSEETVAIWMRAEAALLEDEVEARVRAIREDGVERLILEAESVAFAATVSAMGHKLRPLSREVRPRPRRGGPPRGQDR